MNAKVIVCAYNRVDSLRQTLRALRQQQVSPAETREVVVVEKLMTPADPTPFGANMAFRRVVFDRVGLFDTSRGRKGAVLASGEDGEMFERIHRAGLRSPSLATRAYTTRLRRSAAQKGYLRRWRTWPSLILTISREIPGTPWIGNVALDLGPQFLRAVGRVRVRAMAWMP
jgi:glucosyl-dolichyl phosphate glucuronosyltransferase